MKENEKAKAIPIPSDERKHFYKLNADSELGRQFLKVCEEGFAADKAADKFAKGIGAKMYIPSPYADFGGINAFVLPVKPEPDTAVWKKVDNYKSDSKLAVYIFNTNVITHICLFDELVKVPNDEHFIKGKKEYSYQELIGAVKMKDIAAAAGIKMKYTDPVVFLEYLKFDNDDIKKYREGKVSIKTLLGRKFLVARRDKQMAELAVNADKETKAVLKEIRDKRFGLYNQIVGSDKAVKFFYDASMLPSVPAGTLNGLLKINSHRRIGFARLYEWVYILSTVKSEMENDNDFQTITEDEWSAAVDQVKKHQTKKANE